MTESSDQAPEAGGQADHDNGPRQMEVQTDDGRAGGPDSTTSTEGDPEEAGSFLGTIYSTLDFHIDPFGDALRTIGTSLSESIARVFNGSVDADSMLGRNLEAKRDELAKQAGQSIGRILKSRGMSKGEIEKAVGVNKDRFANVIKGRNNKTPLNINLISDLCSLLDVHPSVLLGDIDEEEFMIIERLRAMSDGDHAAVLQIINSLPSGKKDQ